MSMATAFASDWISYDGRIVFVDGYSWKLRVETYDAVYPVKQSLTSVWLEPTKTTRWSDYYMTIKRRLRDDWTTDVLSSEPELQAELMRQLGPPQ